jgi:hypothetical protein
VIDNHTEAATDQLPAAWRSVLCCNDASPGFTWVAHHPYLVSTRRRRA